MKKKLLTAICFVLVMTMFAGICAYAAPYMLSPWYYGNSNSLIYIKKPASLSATTSERTYTVTAAGKSGVDVTIYRKSNYDGNFYKVYQGGYLLSGTIGASGVYVVSIELVEGGNKMRVYAENNDERQVINIDITRLTKSQIDKINGLSVGDMFSF
ncbi:MAG: hypothetical protein E7410_00365 [Ruminococcaceae bacterium]|nr:hypothetical protein [Oscillospiraceae bacterium]